MSAELNMRRADRRRIIAMDPMAITVQRVTEERGVRNTFTRAVTVLPPQTVRMFRYSRHRSSRPQREVDQPGLALRLTRWALLAPHDADLRATAHTTDEFEVAGRGKFRIMDVLPETAAGGTYGFMAEIEQIS